MFFLLFIIIIAVIIFTTEKCIQVYLIVHMKVNGVDKTR